MTMRKIFLWFLATTMTSTVVAQTADVRRARSGIIITGRGDSLRAMDPFMAAPDGGMAYANAVNRYQRTFQDKARVYCMVIPTSVAFYCPEEASSWTRNEWATIDHLYKQLHAKVGIVDLKDTLFAHADEEIYSRTDHHWAPLGAYYAARAFARVAGIEEPQMKDFEAHTIHDYIGTMYRFSRDASVKQAPETFVYYTPKDTTYTTTYLRYRMVGKKHKHLSENEPEQGPFFYHYGDGSSAAYLTFMHGDLCTTTVRTAAKGGRRLLILKDSFGNALPPFLFHAFEEIHVVDCRYFLRNIVDYVDEHHITDILFANNAGHACADVTQRAYHRYLDQHPK